MLVLSGAVVASRELTEQAHPGTIQRVPLFQKQPLESRLHLSPRGEKWHNKKKDTEADLIPA